MEISQLKINSLELQPPEECMLYRYMTIDKLLDFLFNHRIPLVRLNVFQDKLEGASLEHLLLILSSNKLGEETAPWLGNLMKGIVYNVNPTKRNSLRRQREIFQKTNYASCWYANNHESVAMWQIYSKPDSVAVRIPYKALITEFTNRNFQLSSYDHESLKYGSVHYHRLNDLDDLSRAITKIDIVGFLKDYCFQHEQEFRIMLEIKEYESKPAERKQFILDEQIDRLNELKDLKLLYLSLKNFKTLPVEIIFHPQSLAWHRKNI
jgi:hypothetical protein